MMAPFFCATVYIQNYTVLSQADILGYDGANCSWDDWLEKYAGHDDLIEWLIEWLTWEVCWAWWSRRMTREVERTARARSRTMPASETRDASKTTTECQDSNKSHQHDWFYKLAL